MRLVDERGRGAGRKGGGDVGVAVASSRPVIAQKRSPGCRLRVSMDTPETSAARRRRRARAAARRGRGPSRAGRARRAWSCRVVLPDGLQARAAQSRSEKGSTLSPTIWPVSWPLPAITRTSSGASVATAASMAAARSPISVTLAGPWAPARIAARMAAGASERGLSSVTITASARRAAIAPMIGRLPVSRSPPQPNTTTSRPCASGRRVASTFSSASGLWA